MVKPGATAATINAALAQGLNLLFTPGIYHVDQPINVNRANTVVLGLGLATIIPDNGVTAMKVADVDGVKLAGFLIDAGTVNSPTLLEVGPQGSAADHCGQPDHGAGRLRPDRRRGPGQGHHQRGDQQR